jgi:uncharacterized glyoxalase superfamily protein PhnB
MKFYACEAVVIRWKEMIRLKQLTPNLMVDNVNETVNFYQEILGFELVMSVPQEGVFNWAMVQHGDVSLMFQERENIIGEYPVLKDVPMGGGLTFYIKVRDVKGLYNKVKKRVNIVLDLHKAFYGSEEFAIQDINGFILTFADAAVLKNEEIALI